jgi:hypothetical protein
MTKDELIALWIEIGTVTLCLGFVLGYLAHMYVNQPIPVVKHATFKQSVYKLNEEYCRKHNLCRG